MVSRFRVSTGKILGGRRSQFELDVLHTYNYACVNCGRSDRLVIKHHDGTPHKRCVPLKIEDVYVVCSSCANRAYKYERNMKIAKEYKSSLLKDLALKYNLSEERISQIVKRVEKNHSLQLNTEIRKKRIKNKPIKKFRPHYP